MSRENILIVGGYGEVGRRLAAQLEATEPNRVIVAGRHPEHYALVVDVRGGARTIRATLVGRLQAEATAVGVGAVTEALWSREVDTPGVWLAEEVIAPRPFLDRLATHGIVPVIEELFTADIAAVSTPASAQ